VRSQTASIIPARRHRCVVEFVAARASENLTKLQRSTRRLQQAQFKALAIIKYQQLSACPGTRFGTRGSEVQILSPRPFQSTTCDLLPYSRNPTEPHGLPVQLCEDLPQKVVRAASPFICTGVLTWGGTPDHLVLGHRLSRTEITIAARAIEGLEQTSEWPITRRKPRSVGERVR
jgi:hypothetical protein